MQEITVYDKYGNVLTYLSQWDKNIVIQIKDIKLNKPTGIHFFNCNSKEAMVMSATYKDGILSSQVPNDILTEPHTITGYVWIDENPEDIEYESVEHRSLYCFRIMVRKRAKPLNQVYEDQKEFITFDKILSDAKGYALLSQSYAIGDTNIREGENTDNAEHYKNEAEKSALAAAESADSVKSLETKVEKLAEKVDSQTTIVQDAAKEVLINKNDSEKFAIRAESFAHGGTKTRLFEETDNAEFYCKESEKNSLISKEYLAKIEAATLEAIDSIKNALDMDKPNFQMDLSTGNLMYEGGRFVFLVNKEGFLEWGLAL